MERVVAWRGRHYEVEALGAGCYAAVAQPGSGAVSNAGFVDLGETVLVFDTSQTQQAAAELQQAVDDVLGRTIGFVVNSHWHGDHIRGNQMFPNATIVAPKRTRDLMASIHPERMADQQRRMHQGELTEAIRSLEDQRSCLDGSDTARSQRLREEIAFLRELEQSLPTLQLTLPTVTFLGTWRKGGSRRLVECRDMGSGHTEADAVLYVPDQQVCFMGDLLVVNGHMRIADGDIHHWIEIVEEVKQWDMKWVVPGHGPVTTEPHWDRVIQYFRDVMGTAETLAFQRKEPSQVSQSDIPAPYRGWSDPDIFVSSVRHLMAQTGS